MQAASIVRNGGFYPETTVQETLAEAEKNAPRYLMHRYFTRRPWNIVRQYILHHTLEGQTVLDPFSGSGVTAVEALAMGRKAIAVDLSPLASYITRMNSFAPVNLFLLEETFRELERECHEAINLIMCLPDSAIRDLDYDRRYEERLRTIRLSDNSDVRTADQLYTRRQIAALSVLMSSIEEVKDPVAHEIFRFAFSAGLVFNNIMYNRGSSSPFSLYRFWVPKEVEEPNVWEIFARRYHAILKGKQETNHLIGERYGTHFQGIHGSATDLTSHIAEDSVDYIFTDPPYGKHITYLDLTDLWSAWLDWEITPAMRDLEAIQGGNQRKTLEDYQRSMTECYSQMYKVMREGAWLSVVFHHKNLRLWEAAVNCAQQAGFVYDSTIPQPMGKLPSLHRIKNVRVIAGELIINFRKLRGCTGPGEIFHWNVQHLVEESLALTILRNGGASIDQVLYAILPRLMDSGKLNDAVADANIEELVPDLNRLAVQGPDNRWYLTIEGLGKLRAPSIDKMRYVRELLVRDDPAIPLARFRRTLLEYGFPAAQLTDELLRNLLADRDELSDAAEASAKHRAPEQLNLFPTQVAPTVVAEEVPAKRKRGRPRKVVEVPMELHVAL